MNLTKTTGMLAIASALFTTELSAQTSTTDTVKPFAADSEYRTWSIGVYGGLLNQSNLIGLRREFDKVENKFGYGFFIKKQLLPALGIQADYLGGKIGGHYENNSASFETKMPWSAALSAQLTLANINWRHQAGFIKPYVSLGIGVMDFETTSIYGEITQKYESTTKAFVPVGLGLKFAVAPDVNIDLGYRMSMVRSGSLDGFITNSKDIYSFASLGVEFALGSKAKPVLANSNPVVTMRKEYLAQYDEVLAQKAAMEAQRAENEQMKMQIERLNAELADDDGDGVANRYDKCPNTPADSKVDGAGCPLVEAKTIIKQVVTEEDRRVVEEAIQNLEFDLGKARIRSSSFVSLNKVVTLLTEKNFSLKLAGHTDNTGSMKTNMRLSKARAEAVKAYLVSKGANPSRIEAIGYGPNQPIASNVTADGRQQNRRVEFTLY